MKVRLETRAYFTFVALIGALAVARPVHAWCAATTESGVQAPGAGCGACDTSGVPLHWDRRCVTVSIDPSGFEAMGLSSTSVHGVVDRSFRAWTETACGSSTPGLDVRVADVAVSCADTSFNAHGPNVNAVTVLESWSTHDPPLSPAAFALTFLWFDTETGEIRDADMLVNADQGPYADCGDAPCAAGVDGGVGPVDLANVLTHEAGHFFGLAHSSVETATMYCRAARDEETKRTLDTDDVEGWCATYGSTSLPERCDYTPEGGQAADCASIVSPGPAGCSTRAASSSAPSPGALLLSVALAIAARLRSRKHVAGHGSGRAPTDPSDATSSSPHPSRPS